MGAFLGHVRPSDLFSHTNLSVSEQWDWIVASEKYCEARGITAPYGTPEHDAQHRQAQERENVESLERQNIWMLGMLGTPSTLGVNEMQSDESASARADSAELQSAYDPAYRSALGTAAPPRMYGESLETYDLRLVRPLQKHSPKFANADLGRVTDRTVRNDTTAQIRADALATATRNEGPLRSVVTVDPTGRRVTKWYGAMENSPFQQFKMPYRFVRAFGSEKVF